MRDPVADDRTILIAERHAKAGCGPAYEAVVGGMFSAARDFPGFSRAHLTPPVTEDGAYRVEMAFATAADLEAWKVSDTRRAWVARIDTVADGEPEFRFLSGMEAWFTGPQVPTARPPRRWKMALLTWFGILPTVALILWFVPPLLEQVGMVGPAWFLPRTALITVLMTWLVMPNITKLFKRFLAN